MTWTVHVFHRRALQTDGVSSRSSYAYRHHDKERNLLALVSFPWAPIDCLLGANATTAKELLK